MTTSALVFMLVAWACVLGLTAWSYKKLLSTPPDEKLPPPGSIP